MKKNPSTRCNIASHFWQDRYDILATLEFTRTRKSMSVICAPKVRENEILFYYIEYNRKKCIICERCSREYFSSL